MMFFEQNDDFIDYDKKTPYTFEKYETKNGVKYKIIYTVSRGVADSRIITYEVINLGEDVE